jgi:DNA ligase-1
MILKPMLAAKLEWQRVRYPVYVSPKIDGIRMVVEDGQPWSRTHKVLPNRHLRDCVWDARELLEHLDGEVVVGKPTAPEVYNKTMSGIMSEMGLPIFQYLVFDYVKDEREPYCDRIETLKHLEDEFPGWVRIVPQILCRDREQIEDTEEKCLALGYEGVIVRGVRAPYKQGRSTATQGWLLKLKRYEDAEAYILGTEELMHNENEAFTDVQGHTTRTSHQAGQRAGGVLGALVVELIGNNTTGSPGTSERTGIVFKIGTGYDFGQRNALWQVRDKLVGRIVKFKYMPHGMLESTGVPRHPVYLGLRDPMDF